MILADLVLKAAAAAEQALPDDGYGLLGLIVITIPSMFAAAGTAWVLIRQSKTRGQVESLQQNVASVQQGVATVQQGVSATTAQVVNGHAGKPALRKDIDDIIEAVGKHGVSLAELRGEMRGLTHRVDQLTEK